MWKCVAIGISIWIVAAFVPATAAAQYTVRPGAAGQPNRGPQSALGLIIWNHGVSGQRDQSTFGVPPYIDVLFKAGWDVRKIERDGLYESNWTAAGVRHVARTIEEANSATAEGYKRVVLAGQSYGGGITLEAAMEIDVWAIIPSASGYGTAQSTIGGALAGPGKTSETRRQLTQTRAQRVVGIFPYLDENALASADRGKVAREVAEQRGIAYLPLDEKSALVGHGGSSSALMTFAYAACVAKFIDPGFTAKAGINECGEGGLPLGPTRLKETDTLRPAALPSHDWWGAYQGVFIGAWSNPALVSLAIEREGDAYFVHYLLGKTGSGDLRTRSRVPATLVGRDVRMMIGETQYGLSADTVSRHVKLGWLNKEGRWSTTTLRPDFQR